MNGPPVCMCMCLCGRSWPVVSNAVPVSVPPSLPPAVALLFICVHIPLLALSILVGPAQVRLRCCPCCGAFIIHTDGRCAAEQIVFVLRYLCSAHICVLRVCVRLSVSAGGPDEEHAAEEQLLPQPCRLCRPNLRAQRGKEALR